MIRVKIFKKKNQIDKIIFRGHANYDDYGKDIVCAASSATILTTINGILSINKSSIKVEQNDNNIDINIVSKDEITMKLIRNMIQSLKSIEKNYPKNIEIIEEEKA